MDSPIEKLEALVRQFQETYAMKTTFNPGKLPAGTYYVGDLCYVIEDDEWDGFCDRSFPGFSEEVIGILETSEGVNYANFSTKYGDGGYRDAEGREYSVDSGCIGCIPVSAMSKDKSSEEIARLGNIISFDEEFEVGYDDETGVIRFGEVEIMTGDYEDEEEEDEYIGYGEPEDAE